jgi:hypothetical protein
MSPVPFIVWQAMEQKYALDEFWIQKLDFKRRVDASAFANLHEVKSIVNNIFLLVVRNNLGPKEVAEWQENLVFIEYLATNLGSQSHSWAMQKLKEVFGGRQAMSSSKKSLADRIVRQTPQRTQGMIPQIQLPPPPQNLFGGGLGMMAPMHPVPFGPVQHFAPPGGLPPRPFGGTCYICQQQGHMAKNYPYSANQPPRGNNVKRGGPKRHGKRR